MTKTKAKVTCSKNRYILIFFVTTAITSSCTHALRRNVTNIAEVLESL